MPQKRNESASTGRLTIQFTNEDRDLLDRLVAARGEEMRLAVGQAVPVSIVSYLRWLLEKDAKERGLLASTPRSAGRKGGAT
jgi:hypothetical protein